VGGIAGYWGYAAPDISATIFAGFIDSLAHRGPDGSGINHFPDMRLWLGHRRLSLLAPAQEERQPLADAQRRYWLTFDGTLYNDHTLRDQLRALGHTFDSRSTAEVVLAAYAQWGTDCLRRFDGMWAVAIWDSRDRQLFLARDNLGIKPLHYIMYGGAVAFASEPQAFLRLRGIDSSFDKSEATSRRLPHGLRDLRAGHAIIIDASGEIRDCSLKRMWRGTSRCSIRPAMQARQHRSRRHQPRGRRRERRRDQ
jgi:asparagine synthase (glutamine-hydrolysing)